MTRITRRRILAGVSAGLLAASFGVATASAASAAPGLSVRYCALGGLPYPADSYRAGATAIDPTGRFAAGSGLRIGQEANELLLLVWDNRRLTTVVSPLADDVADVNAHGVVVGNGWVEGFSQPWRYRDGRVAPLPVPPGSTGTSAVAINGAGDIVGAATTADGTSMAVLWPAARPGTVEAIVAPAEARASDITDDGTIVGTAGDFAAWTAWVRHPDGRIGELTMPGARTATVAAAAGRWAVGQVDRGGNTTEKVRWNLHTGTATALDPAMVTVTDVNAAGVVVGDDRISRGAGSVVLPGGGSGVAIGARAIADNGTVVGFRNDTRVSPVRWIGC